MQVEAIYGRERSAQFITKDDTKEALVLIVKVLSAEATKHRVRAIVLVGMPQQDTQGYVEETMAVFSFLLDWAPSENYVHNTIEQKRIKGLFV